MSNVKKPEPVAWHINKENRKEGFLTDLASDAEIHMALMERYKGISVVPLITTAQSEAYTAERVQEVLEQLAEIAMNAPITMNLVGDDGAKATAWHISAQIRALIPKRQPSSG